MSKIESGVLLKRDIKALGIISANSSQGCFKPASYDLRIGDDWINPGAGEQNSSHKPLRDKKIVVEPFGSLIVSTHEVLKIPNNVVGKFNIRIKQALRGLFVQMGTQIEPGYHGRLFAVLNNITAESVELNWEDDPKTGRSRDRLFTVEFFTAKGSVPKPKSEMAPLLDIGKFVNSSQFAKSSISSVVADVKNCTKQIESVKKDILEQRDVIFDRVSERFSGVLTNLQTEWKAVKSVGEAQSKIDEERIGNIEEQYNTALGEVKELETKLGKDIEAIKSTRKQLIGGVIFAGLFLMFLSVMIPVFISYALNQSSPWTKRDTGESNRAELQILKAELASFKGTVANDINLANLSAQIRKLQSTILALEAKKQAQKEDLDTERSPKLSD